MSRAAERSRVVPDAALLQGLRPLLSAGACELEIVDRVPNPRASSCPSELVTVRRDGVELPRLFCKFELVRSDGDEVHRRGLAYEGLVNRWIPPGLAESLPHLFGSFRVGPQGAGLCLVLEAMPDSVHLKSVQRVPDAAAWIGRFHARSEQLLLRDRPEFLRRYDAAHFAFWRTETERVAREHGLEAGWLGELLSEYTRAIPIVSAVARVLVHGELYPHNILVSADGVHPVDWESAGIGPGVIDLASLTMGWPQPVVAACTDAYVAARWRGTAPQEFEVRLRFARLYLCLRMLGDRPKDRDAGGPGFFDYLRATAQECGYLGDSAHG